MIVMIMSIIGRVCSFFTSYCGSSVALKSDVS